MNLASYCLNKFAGISRLSLRNHCTCQSRRKVSEQWQPHPMSRKRSMAYLVVSFLALSILIETNAQIGPFPPNFIWGVATSAYQVEGGWNASGKGVSIWDTYVHKNPSPVLDHSTGDVACDSYHLWETDIRLLRNLAVTHYRFSLSWTRLLPDGTTKHVNQDGVNYYNNLINGLLAANITPMVTLFHWDAPQTLEDIGGWKNPDSTQWFLDYATFCFQTFGDRVKMWITFNEPWVISWLGYGVGVIAPGKVDPCVSVYTITHNIIKAHAMAYRAYDTQFRSKQKGMVGITLNCDFKTPGSNNSEDIAAADRGIQFQMGWFAHPIYVDGDYPQVMKDRVANHSKALNISIARLPVFEEYEKYYIKGSADFFGVNAYSAVLTLNQDQLKKSCSYDNDMDINVTYCDNSNGSCSNWLKLAPTAMRALLNYIKNKFESTKPIIITENGWSDTTGTLDDYPRIEYLKEYISNVYLAYAQDGVNVQGYTAWSLMDNMEFSLGYTQKYGLHYVNFSDPSRPRTAKKSAQYYRDIILNNTMNAANTTTTAPSTTTTSTATMYYPSASTVFQFMIVALFIMKFKIL